MSGDLERRIRHLERELVPNEKQQRLLPEWLLGRWAKEAGLTAELAQVFDGRLEQSEFLRLLFHKRDGAK